MGDFNLDAGMAHRNDYIYRAPMAHVTDLALTHNLTQIVTFNTWSRIIKGIRKESMLDQVYVNNYASVSNISYCIPAFGDHVLVIVDLHTKAPKTVKEITKRDWSCYSPPELNNEMYLKLVNSNVDWASLNVNEHWNALEDIIISCVDNCAPLKTFVINENNFETIPGTIKNKINKRN